MGRLRICVVGYGNVGKETAVCIRQSPDMELAGVVEIQKIPFDAGCPVVAGVEELGALGKVDVAVLAVPSRSVGSVAPLYLAKGINTVDCFDVHGQAVLDLRRALGQVATGCGAVAVLSSGWDPGTNSVIRMLFQAMAPRGITCTNYGPGMSMGHTVAAKAVSGVKAALSMTVPLGAGSHRRDVYLELDEGVSLQKVTGAILNDPYFVNDETRVTAVPSVAELQTTGHGVLLERHGGSGSAENQDMGLTLRINNPSLTAQIMVAAARASTRLAPGAYTLPEIPPVHLLPGNKEDLLKRLI